MFHIFIAGDRYFEPDYFIEEAQKKLGPKYPVKFSGAKFDFPQEKFSLFNSTVVPTGMSFEDPNVEKPSCPGIDEYYGDPMLLNDYVADVDMIVIHGAPLPRAVIEKATALKCVVCMRGGPINIDKKCLDEKGIPLYHTTGKNAPAVAEFTVGLLLSFLRNIPGGSNSLHNGVWPLAHCAYETTGVEMFGKSYGLIGFGAIARHLSRILKGMGLKIKAFDPYVEDSVFDELGVEKSSFEEVLSSCDFVSLHARVPKGDPPLIGTKELSLMKPSAILVNTARGTQLDYRALKKALDHGTIRGCVLDVLGSDDFGFYNELIAMPNVLVTPHMAGCSQETVHRAVSMTVEQMDGILAQYL